MLVFIYIIIGLIAVTFTLLLAFSSGKMIPLTNANGHVLKNSLSEKSWVNINGVDMGMIIKATDYTRPILLFVHGGPGMPEYWLNATYPSRLEELFTVVWWDQRGAGLSYSSQLSPDTMTTEQLVKDTISVTNFLRQRFRRDKIYLMAHSYGTYIGIQAAAQAQELYHAYFGMAQVSNQALSEQLAYDFMLDFYRNAEDQKTVQALEKAPWDTAGYQKIRDRVMHEAGIGTAHNMYSVFTGIFMGVMKNREYLLNEKVNLWLGKAFSKNTVLNEEFKQCHLIDTVTRLEIPVYFFSGAYDYTVNHYLSEDYLEEIRAPKKHFYLFENSAHSPLFEEPDRMIEILKTLR